MPQMNPMNWNLIFLLNMSNFFFIFCLIYFSKLKNQKINSINYMNLSEPKIKLNFKW